MEIRKSKGWMATAIETKSGYYASVITDDVDDVARIYIDKSVTYPESEMALHKARDSFRLELVNRGGPEPLVPKYMEDFRNWSHAYVISETNLQNEKE